MAATLTVVERDIMRRYGRGANISAIAAAHGMPTPHAGHIVLGLCGLNRQRAAAMARTGELPPGTGETLTSAPAVVAKPKRTQLSLSATEALVLPLLPELELTGAEIAVRIDRTTSSVFSAMTKIYQKLGVTGRLQAVDEARRRDLLPADRVRDLIAAGDAL